MAYADVGSRRLYYEQRGSGAPLVLIQGMAGHHRMWGEQFLDALAKDFDVVTFDHRGVGYSTDIPGQFTIADLAADSVALLDALGWSDAHIMGISLGGMVAQELALLRPDRVRKLVLGCTYAGGPGTTMTAGGPLRMIQPMITGNVDVAIRTAYEVNLSPGLRQDEGQFERFKAACLSVRVPVPTVLRQAQASFVHNTSARLPDLAAATLVVHGTLDEMVAAANGRYVAELIPKARLEILDGLGHLFWWERPALAAGLVRAHCLG
ncbi:MAG: alpha/beta hydrolase [Actinomycetota bacterium]|nr:alpha/beta hydrolase [Actinomycetota bacterium]